MTATALQMWRDIIWGAIIIWMSCQGLGWLIAWRLCGCA